MKRISFMKGQDCLHHSTDPPEYNLLRKGGTASVPVKGGA